MSSRGWFALIAVAMAVVVAVSLRGWLPHTDISMPPDRAVEPGGSVPPDDKSSEAFRKSTLLGGSTRGDGNKGEDPVAKLAGAFERGSSELEAGNYERAVPELQNALLMKPDFAEAHANLALALMGRAKAATPESEKAARRAVELEPRSRDILFVLARVLARAGKLEEALDQLAFAVELESEDVPASREIRDRAAKEADLEALRRLERFRGLVR